MKADDVNSARLMVKANIAVGNLLNELIDQHSNTVRDNTALAFGAVQAAAIAILADKADDVPSLAMRDAFLKLAGTAFDLCAQASDELFPATGGRA